MLGHSKIQWHKFIGTCVYNAKIQIYSRPSSDSDWHIGLFVFHVIAANMWQ